MFKIERNQLLAALGSAFAMAAKNTPKDIVKNVLCRVTSREVMFHSNDIEVGISFLLPVDSIEAAPGTQALFPPRLLDLVKGLPSGLIEVSCPSGDAITVKAPSGEWTFLTVGAAEYPELSPGLAEFTSVSASGSQLKLAITKVLGHVEEESTRYALGGIYFDFEHSALAATDGRRLAVCPVEFQYDEPPAGVIVPAKAMRAVLRELGDSEQVSLEVRNHSVTFNLGESSIFARLIEGRFPQYRQVIPDSHEFKAVCSAPELVNAIKLAAVVANKETRGIDFSFAAESVSLKAVGSDVGESLTHVPLRESESHLEITLDQKLSQTCLTSHSDVTLYGIDSDSALKIVDECATYVLMPLSRE